ALHQHMLIIRPRTSYFSVHIRNNQSFVSIFVKYTENFFPIHEQNISYYYDIDSADASGRPGAEPSSGI
ncbi:MAG: hypothetical protein K2M12_03060, partial [Muribaculaceae bacterium]|nr:hypothetical protein [Muribaculaceae bacterium]